MQANHTFESELKIIDGNKSNWQTLKKCTTVIESCLFTADQLLIAI